MKRIVHFLLLVLMITSMIATAEAKSHKIFGVHILASLAPDMIHEGVLAVKHGLTLEDIIDTVHVFPTHSEAIKLAALSFFEDVDKLSCCAI